MSTQKPNRIAAEHLSGVSSWLLPEVGDGAKVLSSAEKEQREREARANEVMEDVEGDVELTPITAEELQALTAEAEKEGFDKGYREGFAKGEADGKKLAIESTEKQAKTALDAQVGALLQIAEALMNPIADQEQQLKQMLLSYVTTLTQELLSRELKLDSQCVLQTVQAAIDALPVGAQAISVTVNPEDLELVEQYAESQSANWSFITDSDLQRGGCVVKTPDSTVLNTVEQRLRDICQKFLDAELHKPGSDDNHELT